MHRVTAMTASASLITTRHRVDASRHKRHRVAASLKRSFAGSRREPKGPTTRATVMRCTKHSGSGPMAEGEHAALRDNDTGKWPCLVDGCDCIGLDE